MTTQFQEHHSTIRTTVPAAARPCPMNPQARTFTQAHRAPGSTERHEPYAELGGVQ
ncbi:hypothetical protein ACIRPT_17095 [Streptomyces sp. NPDC101227]|uniref:hypothetical protein n=1 Tax=Streptomyces sp. NPDC101227 TaxID=3366136 RepID=UPI0037FCB924